MTICAIRRQPLVKIASGRAFRSNRGDDNLNFTVTGQASITELDLYDVDPANIGDKTGSSRSSVLQNCFAFIWFIAERPMVIQVVSLSLGRRRGRVDIGTATVESGHFVNPDGDYGSGARYQFIDFPARPSRGRITITPSASTHYRSADAQNHIA